MYHSTPHSVTGKTPFDLMKMRTPRDKLPCITESFEDSETREKDMLKKQQGKEYSDAKRGAKESDIKEGDPVVVKNFHKQNKLSPNFIPNVHKCHTECQ